MRAGSLDRLVSRMPAEASKQDSICRLMIHSTGKVATISEGEDRRCGSLAHVPAEEARALDPVTSSPELTNTSLTYCFARHGADITIAPVRFSCIPWILHISEPPKRTLFVPSSVHRGCRRATLIFSAGELPSGSQWKLTVQ